MRVDEHRHTQCARLTRRLKAVGVGVDEEQVADRELTHKAGVDKDVARAERRRCDL